ncbi:MAG: hypothetical protein ACPG77_00545 [Nannocystaceae bacterium]
MPRWSTLWRAPGFAARIGLAGMAVASVIASGCGMDLPAEERIASTRILAIRSEVTVAAPTLPDNPELGPRTEALPFEQVQITPFVVDDSDVVDPDTIAPIWIACELGPGQGLFGCIKAAFPTTVSELPACPVPSFLDLDIEGGGFPDYPSPCVLAEDTGVLNMTIPLTASALLGGDLEITMIGQGSSDGPTSKSCADTLLSGDTSLPGTCLHSVQRLSIGPREQFLALAANFGLDVPPEFGEVPDPEDIPDGDRNPRINSFSVTVIHPDDSREELGPIEAGGTVSVGPDDTLDIRVDAPEGDLQTYQVPINGGADGYEDRQETYRGAWFRSWGELLSNSSNDHMSRNEWKMVRGDQDEDDLPPGNRATLYHVLRDSRQGVTWWWIHAEVTP